MTAVSEFFANEFVIGAVCFSLGFIGFFLYSSITQKFQSLQREIDKTESMLFDALESNKIDFVNRIDSLQRYTEEYRNEMYRKISEVQSTQDSRLEHEITNINHILERKLVSA